MNSVVNVPKTQALAIQEMALANVQLVIPVLAVNKNVHPELGDIIVLKNANPVKTEAYAHNLTVNVNVRLALRAIFANVDALRAFGA